MTFRQGVAIGIGIGVVLTLFGGMWLLGMPIDWFGIWS